MDIEKIGCFIAKLRKEKGLTQSQLGERLGVTNKTISRWETGSYMPSVDMLLQMSEEFGVSINEILNGERLSEESYKPTAEKTIAEVLKSSTFTLGERKSFWKKKWLRENLFVNILLAVVCLCLFILAAVSHRNELAALGSIAFVAVYLLRYNRMMAYIEQRAY